jgi:RNA polymerase sigma-70 factor (ECF subfamily)
MVAYRIARPSLTVVPPVASHALDQPRVLSSDEEILGALRRGAGAVAADFYRRVKPVVDRTVRRLLGRLDSEAEDLVQVALIQLIESLPRYRGECPIDAWVSAVSANVVYKHIRRRRLERNIFVSLLDEEQEFVASQVATGVTQTTLLRETVKRIAEHLAAMRPDRAWAFVLHDVCGYSLDEVSHICGSSVVAAQSRLVRGRREIHERIAADPRLAEMLEQDEP